MIRRSTFAVVVACLIAIGVVTACGPTAPSASPIEPGPGAAALTEAQVDEAVRVRNDFGLVADEEWVRRVAADPRSERKFGVPMMPDEIASLEERLAGGDTVMPAVLAYGEKHADTWAGAEIDQAKGGIIVVRVSGQSEQHRLALHQLVGDRAVVEVQEVEWSLTELESFRDQIEDTSWLRQVPAHEVGFGIHHGLNAVLLQVSSPRPDAVAVIAARYGNPGWLIVESDGVGSGLLEVGTATVVATDDDGQPVVGLHCSFAADFGTTYAEGWVTDQRGVCQANLKSTGYWVSLARGVGQAREVVAITRILIAPGAQSRVDMTVSPNP